MSVKELSSVPLLLLLIVIGNARLLHAQVISFNDGNDHAIVADDEVVDKFIEVSNESRLKIQGRITNRFEIILGETEALSAIDVTNGDVVLASPPTGTALISAGLPVVLRRAATMEAYSGRVTATGGVDIPTVGVDVSQDARLGLFGANIDATSGSDEAFAVSSRGEVLMTAGTISAEGGSGEAVAVRVNGGRFDMLGGKIYGNFKPGLAVDAGTLVMNGGTIANAADGFPVDAPGVRVSGTAIFADGVVRGDGTDASIAVTVAGQATFSGATMSGAVAITGDGRAYVSNVPSFGQNELQLRLTDNAQVTIAATELNYPADQPIADLTGRVTGKWANGEAFSMAFDRSAAAAINFAEPVQGDFDGDRKVTASDIDLISASLNGASSAVQFDVTSDGLVDETDRQRVIHELAGSVIGDSNMDGRFDSADLIRIFEANTYEDDYAMNSRWETGDWNGDLEFGTADLIFAFQAGTYETDSPAARMVPEPTFPTGFLMLTCSIFRSLKRRKPALNRTTS